MENSEAIASHQVKASLLYEKTPSQAAQEIFEKQMNVDKSTIRHVLEAAMSQGGDFADLYFEYTLRNSIILEEGIVKNSSKAVIMGVGIRVLKGDQTGYAYSEDLDIQPMLHAARTAASIATGGNVKIYEAHQFNEIVPPNHYKVLHSITDLAISEKIRLIQEVEKVAHRHDERIVKVTATLADSIKFLQIATSEGKIVRDARPMFRMSVQCIAKREKTPKPDFQEWAVA